MISDPFMPGTGTLPRNFAGRDVILKRIIAEADPLYQTKCGAPRGDIVLHGPQGSGKTALLRKVEAELKKKAEPKDAKRKEDSDFVVMRWTPEIELQSLETAIKAVMPGGLWGDFLKGLPKAKRLRVFGFGVDFEAPEPPDLRSALMGRLEEDEIDRPFVVLIDDAQELKPRVASALLNTGQQLRVEDRPFLLVLAGTDKLLATLGAIDATFCERSTLMSLGPLDEDDAKKVLEGPLKQRRATVEGDAWPVLLGGTHDLYPHYVQEIGAEAIRQLNRPEVVGNNRRKITRSIAEKIVGSLDRVKTSRLQDVRQASGKYIDRREQMERLRSRNAKLKESARERGRQLADAQLENGDLKSRNAKLEEAARDRDRQLADLRSANDSLRSRNVVLEDTARDRDRHLADLRSANDGLRSRKAELEEAARERDRQLADLRSENGGLGSRKAELEEAARDRDRQLADLRSENDGLRSRKTELEDAARRGRLQLADMQSKDEDLNYLNSRNAELEGAVRDRDQQLADLKSRNAKLEDAAKDRDRQLADISSRNNEIERWLDQTKNQHPRKWRWLFGATTPPAIREQPRP